MAHFLISAAHKSSGKTTVSIGVCAELRRRGLSVRPFKKGPDYIDPLWLSQASGHSCCNLDFFTQSESEIVRDFEAHLAGGTIGVLEGNKGLYDGMDLRGSNSNAALAILLNAPVVLVLDTQGTTRGVAPLLLGYQAFDDRVNIAGVILNKVAGSRHESKLRDVISHYTDVEVLGAIHRNPAMEIVERHLGLVPSNEAAEADRQIEGIRRVVEQQLDWSGLLSIAASAGAPRISPGPPASSADAVGRGLRIGVARDEAFGFYYPGDLRAMEAEKAELVFFSPIRDTSLPEVDGVFLGGGFPEVGMDTLASNQDMLQSVRAFVDNGGPLYAECGGLMYLARSVIWRDKRCRMVGLVPGDAVMHDKPRGRGYVRLQRTSLFPWPVHASDPEIIDAHEFHYSQLENLDADLEFAYRMERGSGIDGSHDGFLYKNMLANYTHLRHVDRYPWTHRFLSHVRRCKRRTR